MKLLRNLVNLFAICVVVAVVAFNWNDVQAQEKAKQFSKEDLQCLSKNIFFEARNQTISGKVAVAWVTLNRMENSKYPDTICGVVTQAQLDANNNPIKHKCQFSWYCDGKSDRIPSNVVAQRAWEDAQLVAQVVVLDWIKAKKSPVGEAIMYHADYVKPYWAASYAKITKVDSHVFYE
jgi:spore germination cell wall hydrolase CwlJ-like protein